MVAVPLILLGLVVLHLLALHEVGSNNPDGVDIKKKKDANGVPLDGVAFHPYYTVHDLMGISVFLFVFCTIIFFLPEMGGYFLEYANFEEANGLKTPLHIAPVWYYTPFYSMLRAVTVDIGPLTVKFLGFITMGSAIAILFVLPWLDRSPVRSMRYKGSISRVAILVFSAAFVILGVLGVRPPTPERTALAQFCTLIYFSFFLLMPFYTSMEKTKPEPVRVTMDGGMGFWKTLGAVLVVALLIVVPLKAVGSEAEKSCGTVECDHFVPALSDQASLQRGAKYFVSYCMGCHSMKYARYERTATDLGIPLPLAQENLIFDDAKIGDLMYNAMPAKLGKTWFGATPPDLTLISRARSPEYIYTYLRNFYRDDSPSRAWGVNNRVFKDVAMPHALLELQGLPECAPGPVFSHNGGVKRDPLTGEDLLEDPCGRLVVKKAGMMSSDEFDAAVGDLTSFLAYVSEPMALQRQRLGGYVLLFIFVFGVFSFLLNREYWKDVH